MSDPSVSLVLREGERRGSLQKLTQGHWGVLEPKLEEACLRVPATLSYWLGAKDSSWDPRSATLPVVGGLQGHIFLVTTVT